MGEQAEWEQANTVVKVVNIPPGDVYPRLMDIFGNLRQKENVTKGINELHLRRRC